MKNQPSRCLRTSLASMTLFLLMSFQAVALQVAEAQVTDAQIEAQKSPSSALQDNLQIPCCLESVGYLEGRLMGFFELLTYRFQTPWNNASLPVASVMVNMVTVIRQTLIFRV